MKKEEVYDSSLVDIVYKVYSIEWVVRVVVAGKLRNREP